MGQEQRGGWREEGVCERGGRAGSSCRFCLCTQGHLITNTWGAWRLRTGVPSGWATLFHSSSGLRGALSCFYRGGTGARGGESPAGLKSHSRQVENYDFSRSLSQLPEAVSLSRSPLPPARHVLCPQPPVPIYSQSEAALGWGDASPGAGTTLRSGCVWMPQRGQSRGTEVIPLGGSGAGVDRPAHGPNPVLICFCKFP